MEKAETRAVLMGLAELYPSSFSKHTDEGTWFVLEMWHDILKDEDARLVKAAVRACVSDNDTNFAPPIGQIRAKMKELAGVGGNTAEEAFNTARAFWCSGAVTGDYMEAEREWKKLPEEIRRIYTPADMIELAKMTTHEILSFEKPKFMKQYEEIRQQKLSLDLQTKSITQLAYEQNGVLMLADKQERKELTYGPDGSQPA